MRILSVLLLMITAIATTACYRMPCENDYSVVPMTNSPDLWRPSDGVSPMSNMNY